MNRSPATLIGGCALALLSALSVHAQQVTDSAFRPTLRTAQAFAAAGGPVVVIDEAHQNFHTAAGRYRPFARLLEADGFSVRSGTAPFDSASLAPARVLVIANALGGRDAPPVAWSSPVASAFQPAEIAAVVRWVERGGSLLLIADHHPFAGAADSLAYALDVFFANGFALAPPYERDSLRIVFRRGKNLKNHPVLEGRSRAERVDSVVSFTGSAFWVGSSVSRARELMRLPTGTRVLLPVVAWQFSDSTPRIHGEGMLQGATFRRGRGRVAVFGEAAMFSAQLTGAQRVPMGMNAPDAADNPQFVLNVLHWLSGLGPD